MIERLLVLVLFLLGLWGIASRKNVIRKVFGLAILNSAVVILFVLEGSRIGSHAPILTGEAGEMVDPVPQALMLTAIVMGVCITALALALAYRLYKATGTFDIDEIKKRLDHDGS